MKKIFLALITFTAIVTSCKTANKVTASENTLEGLWQLNYISGPKISFDGLYAETIPSVTFDLKQNRFSGTNSCNRFSGSFTVDNNKISFNNDKIAMTMMACQGNGDQVFMSTLQKIDSYMITGDGRTLNFLMNNVSMMRFQKITEK